MKALKYSRQREAIKNFLSARKDHPTADMIYSHIREDFPNISLGTVYRNLSLLAERGEILKLSCGNNADHFDGCTRPHYHFFCRKCQNVSDLELPSMDIINLAASENFNGKIEGHTLYFFGICKSCSDLLKPEEEKFSQNFENEILENEIFSQNA